MSLTGETSRTPLTTPGGTAYAKVVVTNPANSDVYWCYVPDVVATFPVVMFAAHGAGGDEDYLETYAPDAIPLAMDRGWVIVCPRATPAGWGNDTLLGRYVAAQTWATAEWGTHIAILHGGSMGGQTVALLAARGDIDNLAAWASFDGAVSLSYAYGKSYQAAINTAYGIPPAEYATATAGHDPVLKDAADYAGQTVFLAHSTEDTSIEKVYNSDVLYALINPVADVTYTATTGSHSTEFLETEADAFFAAAVTAYVAATRRRVAGMAHL